MKDTTVTPEISREQRNALLRKQQGKCPICLAEIWNDSHLDHCHATGQIRGLLCRSCNIALGRLGDNVAALERAIKWLGGKRESQSDQLDQLSRLLQSFLFSPTNWDCNGEPANITDAIIELARAIRAANPKGGGA